MPPPAATSNDPPTPRASDRRNSEVAALQSFQAEDLPLRAAAKNEPARSEDGKSVDGTKSVASSGTRLSVGGQHIDVPEEILASIPKELLRDLDEDQDGHITFEEILKTATDRAKKHKQVGIMRKVIVGLVVAVFAVVSLNAIATMVSLEAAKESHVHGSTMVNKQGEPVRVASSDLGLSDGTLCPRHENGTCMEGSVKTGEVRYYSSLFDLPLFDSRTLAELRVLTLQLKNNEELSITVSGAKKHENGKAATLYGASGAKVVIDGQSMTAFAVVEGERHLIQNPRQRLRRLEASEANQTWQPRLYSEQDFFTEENGFDIETDGNGRQLRRRLSSDSFHSGFAVFAMAVGEAMIGYHEEVVGVKVEDHIEIQAKVYASDTYVQRELDMTMLYFKGEPLKSRILFYEASTGQRTLTSYYSRKEVTWNGDEVKECNELSEPELPSVLTEADFANSEGGVIFESIVDGTSVVVEIYGAVADGPVSSAFDVPHDECAVAGSDATADTAGRRLKQPGRDLEEEVLDEEDDVEEVVNGTRTGRRLASVGYSTGWLLSQAAYGHNSRPALPSGWSYASGSFSCNEAALSNSANAVAKLVKNGNTRAIIIAGSDDIWDWLQNIGGAFADVNGCHSGFWHYANSLGSCVAGLLGGNQADYVIGHSLGGAASSIFYSLNGGLMKSSTQVVTYGAPLTCTTSCNIPGTRYVHINDIVGSSVASLFGLKGWQHQQSSGYVHKETSRRRRWSVWSRRRRAYWEWKSGCATMADAGLNLVDAFNKHLGYDENNQNGLR
jgi:hypothetical protein